MWVIANKNKLLTNILYLQMLTYIILKEIKNYCIHTISIRTIRMTQNIYRKYQISDYISVTVQILKILSVSIWYTTSYFVMTLCIEKSSSNCKFFINLSRYTQRHLASSHDLPETCLYCPWLMSLVPRLHQSSCWVVLADLSFFLNAKLIMQSNLYMLYFLTQHLFRITFFLSFRNISFKHI